MSRLSDIIRQVAKADPQLAKDLQRETDALEERRAFGLNFERHTPEVVELPGRPVRKNDKVRILPERGELPRKENERLYRVTSIVSKGGDRWANVAAMDDPAEKRAVVVDNLVVVAEFRDPIYPGLVSTGSVDRGGDKSFHTVINAENYHALQALLFTHRGKVDAIYIDPPYNTGARDWKYNNDYVESDDHYRHSKWLAMMERRLLLAKELLNPEDSVLIVTIDEKEYLRLGLLMEQIFPETKIQNRSQMVTTVTNSFGVSRRDGFSRVDEYIFFLRFGRAVLSPPNRVSSVSSGLEVDTEGVVTRGVTSRDGGDSEGNDVQGGEEIRETYWFSFMRAGSNSTRKRSPGCHFPIFVDQETGEFHSVGDPLEDGVQRSEVLAPKSTEALWPMKSDGTEGVWQASVDVAVRLFADGHARIGAFRPSIGRRAVTYLRSGTIARIAAGELRMSEAREIVPVVRSVKAGRTVWTFESHNATSQGTKLLARLLPGRSFPYPKSLYAVEDTLRCAVADKPDALVLDFFAGSGTTTHAVMRLNKQDGGSRRSISITNNEVSADEQKGLREESLRPGDAEWEQWGICDNITKPRIKAAVTGKTPEGKAISGDYKFTDEFAMADGFEENVEFFTLTYESAMRVSSNREFARIAPFLWLRAGSRGRRIDDVSKGWDVADAYGVIANLDLSEPFIKAIDDQDGLTHAFIVTDEDRLFEAMVRQLPEHVEPVRLYSSYLRNFEIEAGRSTR
jgi:adenine-specific DNA-methyltransferase